MNLTTYKFTRRVLSMMCEVNLLNNGNANLLVPKSEVLSADATLRSLISLASTFSLIRCSARHVWYFGYIYTRLIILLDDCGILRKSHKI